MDAGRTGEGPEAEAAVERGGEDAPPAGEEGEGGGGFGVAGEGAGVGAVLREGKRKAGSDESLICSALGCVAGCGRWRALRAQRRVGVRVD